MSANLQFEFLKVPSVGPFGPQRLLVFLFLSMAVCLPAMGGGPSLFLGDKIAVRLNDAINTGRNKSGDRFKGVVDHNIEVDGLVAIPRGAVVEGVLRNIVSSGRLRRRAEVTFELEAVTFAGKRQEIQAQPETRSGQAHAGHDGKFIGGGALFGMVIGALAGGGKGAAVGGLTGAAAGTAGAVMTGKEELYIPSETVMIFRLKSSFSPELP